MATTLRPLRIALVTRQYPPDALGGIGSYVQRLARELHAAGHEPIVVNAAPDQQRGRSVEDGVVVERFGEVGPQWFWGRLERISVLFALRLRASLSAAVAIHALRRFDIIEAPEWKAEGLLLRFLRRGPVIVHLHLLNGQVHEANRWEMGLGVRLANSMEDWSVRLAHAVSVSSLTSITDAHGRSTLARRPHMVPPPMAPEEWRDVRTVDTTEPVVLFVGRLERLKSPETIVRALRAMPSVDGARAVFVGRSYRSAAGVRYDQYLRDLAGPDLSIEIIEPVASAEGMRELFGSARVVAVPSRFETLSMVALEAMAAGRPVVLGTRVGAAELVGDAFTAPTVDSDDIEGWAAAFHRFLSDKAAAAEAGARNRERLESLVPSGVVAEARLALYRSVIDGRKRRTDAERYRRPGD